MKSEMKSEMRSELKSEFAKIKVLINHETKSISKFNYAMQVNILQKIDEMKTTSENLEKMIISLQHLIKASDVSDRSATYKF